MVMILLPEWRLFESPCSTVIFSKNGELLGARISQDQQWRFPPSDSVSHKFERAIITFEDKRFYSHLGVDPLAIGRAVSQLIKHGRVVSGASTLTMQTVRLSRNRQNRNITDKIIETFAALWLDVVRSKQEILALYAANAPFGGNVVGLEAASWRYFGRSSGELSWAEAAMLAVLPNQPSLIHIKRNRELLLKKRNRLLEKLHKNGEINQQEYSLAIEEPIPDEPLPLPRLAPHLLEKMVKEQNGQSITTTIDASLQQRVTEIMLGYTEPYRANQISNMACLVADIHTGNVLAYCGNIFTPESPVKGMEVDVITAPRSSGSILKPLLYAAMLDDGQILPQTLISDIPMISKGFAPKNYNRTFEGAVAANQVIIRSLNVPSVKMLQSYGVNQFRLLLQQCGLTTITRSADDYGLSLILGGAEVTLWDITQLYMSIGRKLQYLPPRGLSLCSDSVAGTEPKLSNAALWIMANELCKVNRPEEEQGWQWFDNHRNISWKTGTSYGNRDGWSIGFTSGHVVAVWVGNADGEGRPGLTGVGYAAPIMFRVFNLLPYAASFEQPEIELQEVEVCNKSGHIATDRCADTHTEKVPEAGVESSTCPYCREVMLDAQRRYRVDSRCYPVGEMVREKRFVLPPVEEWYYRRKHLDYKVLEPLHPDIERLTTQHSLEILFPQSGSEVIPTRGLDGNQQGIVFEAVHTQPNQILFWHIDGSFMGTTQYAHRISCNNISTGRHKLTVVDQLGNSKSVRFTLRM